jgi:biofilm protein TabA
MVTDRIENAELYFHLSPRIEAALKALRDTDITRREPGVYELQGKDLYASVQRYNSNLLAKSKWESHRQYIDVQYVAGGTERMGWCPIGELEVTMPYSTENDALLYSGTGRAFIVCPPRSFTIFFPEDGHMPCVAIDDKPEPIQKTVMKVRI